MWWYDRGIILLEEVSDLVDTGGRDTVGGGEVLDYLGESASTAFQYMNNELINHFKNFTLYKLLICALILIIFAILAMKLLGIRTLKMDTGIKAEIDNIKSLKRTEAQVIGKQRRLQKLQKIVRQFGLEPNQTYVDYMNYNLKRAGYMAPSGDRTLDAYEFNAYVKAGTVLTALICIGVMLFMNMSLGFILLVVSFILWNTLPTMLVRSEAVRRDAIIRNNFFDFYAEIHYILKDGGNVPLAKKIRSYAKQIQDKPEMLRFADNCADLFDLYGEYEATMYISKEYKEIPEVGKLMRLIKQFNDNAEIRQELEGFRQQLITEKQLKMEAAQKKLIAKARWSFNILMIVLVQAILSAMAIYLQDLGGIGGFF